LLLLIQSLAVAGPSRVLGRLWRPAALALGCLLCAGGAAALGLPGGAGEACHRSSPPSRAALLCSLAWTGSLLVLGSAVAVLVARRSPGADGDEEAPGEESDSPSSGSASDAEGPAKGGGPRHAPGAAVSVAFALMLLCLLLQLANAAQVLYTGLPMGSVPELFVLEAMLEHGQLVWLILATAFDEEAAAAVAEACHLGPATQEEDALEELEPLEVALCEGTASPAEGARSEAARGGGAAPPRPQAPLCLVVTTTIFQPG